MGSARWQSESMSVNIQAIEQVERAHRQAIGEGGGLGAAREGHRGCEASLHRLDRLESSTAPQSLVELKS